MGQGSKFRGSTQPSSALADGADWCWYLSLIFELRFVIPSEHLSSTATLLNLICTLGDMSVSSTAPTKSRPGAGHTHLVELVANPRVLPDRRAPFAEPTLDRRCQANLTQIMSKKKHHCSELFGILADWYNDDRAAAAEAYSSQL